MKREAQLWVATLMPAMVWFLSLLANFAVAPWACTRAWKPALFAVTLASLALTTATGFWTWRLWRQVGLADPGETGGAVAAQRALGIAGVILSALFFIVILAQGIPNLILEACE